MENALSGNGRKLEFVVGVSCVAPQNLANWPRNSLWLAGMAASCDRSTGGGSVAQPCRKPTRAASVTALKNAWDKTCTVIVVAQSITASAWSTSRSICLQVRDPATEVELELAGGAKAALTGLGHLLEWCRSLFLEERVEHCGPLAFEASFLLQTLL